MTTPITYSLVLTPERKRLYLGCTAARHARIGIDAVINARGGQQWRNDDTQEQIEMQRDARSVRDQITSRVRFYQFGSRWFRRRASMRALLSTYED